MIRSMTGFGAAAGDVDELAVRVEIRAGNHRHLLVKVRLPGELAHAEGAVDRLVKKELARGSVSVHVHASRSSAAGGAVLDAELAERYRDQLVELRDRLGLDEPVRLETLLSMPGVLDGGEPDAPSTGQERALLGLVREALEGLMGMRVDEGQAIAADLGRNLKALATLTGRIERRMPQVVRTHKKNLAKRVGELLERREAVAESELAREIALLADRLDVGEELSRLESHLERFGELLEKGGTIGRKLDFLVQEVFREVNTIGSKCGDAQVAHWVVEAKTVAERLREQVQNVE